MAAVAVFGIAMSVMLSSFTALADSSLIGGGFAATGQIKNVSYTTELYDATNGLPTSDANCVLGASDGYIWIGGYSGIIKYDGNNFERLPTSNGLTSGRAFFEDSKNRIWIATNDNGVSYWIRSADSAGYDHKGSFDKNGVIDWTQNGIGYKVGDIV